MVSGESKIDIKEWRSMGDGKGEWDKENSMCNKRSSKDENKGNGNDEIAG